MMICIASYATHTPETETNLGDTTRYCTIGCSSVKVEVRSSVVHRHFVVCDSEMGMNECLGSHEFTKLASVEPNCQNFMVR